MNKYKLITISICVLILSNNFAQAQIWKKIQKQVEKKVEKRVEKKVENRVLEEVDEKTDEALDKVFGEEESENDNPDNQSGGLSALLGGSDVELPSKYNLDIAISYQITSGNSDQANITYLFTNSGNQWGFNSVDNSEEITMLIDYDRDVVAMYMTDQQGNKTGQKTTKDY